MSLSHSPIISHKFRAKPQTLDSIHFGSKKEANRYQELLALQRAGEVVFFLRQVPFHLPGGKNKYVCDFVVFYHNGDVIFEEVKGFKTPLYKLKKQLVESVYPIKLTEI